MNCAMGCTICVARGRIPTHTPIGTQITLASAIRMNTRSMVSVARPHTCSASRSGVFLISTATMCHSPSTTAAMISDTHSRSRRSLRLAVGVGAGGSSSRRLTARLVNMHGGVKGHGRRLNHPRAAHHGQRPGIRHPRPRLLLDAEAVHPGDQRPKHQLVVQRGSRSTWWRSPSRWRPDFSARWRARCRSRRPAAPPWCARR